MNSGSPPIGMDLMALYESNLNPSEIHAHNAYLTRFFRKYLTEKAITTLEFEGLPEDWAQNYFLYTLFLGGYIGVWEDVDLGLVCNYGSLSGELDIYYQPKKFTTYNPYFKVSETNRTRTIGEDVELVKLQPTYTGIGDIISIYADLMALSVESAGINLINTRFAYVFAADNANMANSFKAVMDDIASGRPASFADKKLFDENGKLKYDMILAKPKDVYIQSEILNDLCAWEARFNSEIGIPNVNMAKESGVTDLEVTANNKDTTAKATLWRDTVSEGLRKVNQHYGTKITVKLRYEQEVTYDSSGNINI